MFLRYVFYIFFLQNLVKPIQSGRTKLPSLVTIKLLSGVFCEYINLQSENFIPIQSSPLKILMSVSWDQKSFVDKNNVSSAWSEDVTRNGFKACVLVVEYLKTNFKSKPTIHWSVFQKQMFDKVKNINIGSTTFDTWYNGTQCKVVYSLSSHSSNVNVFASIEHPRKKNYQNAMTVWSEVTTRSSNTKDVRVCARELQNFNGVHQGIIVVRFSFYQKDAPSFFS